MVEFTVFCFAAIDSGRFLCVCERERERERERVVTQPSASPSLIFFGCLFPLFSLFGFYETKMEVGG